MSSYTGTAERPDRAKAIAAVIAVHAGLAAIILAGLNVRVVSHVVEQLKTFDIRLPPPPSAAPPAAGHQAAPDEETARRAGEESRGHAGRRAAAADPASLADPGGQGRRHRKRHDLRRGNIRNRHRRRRLGQRPGRRRRLFEVHAGPAHLEISRWRLSRSSPRTGLQTGRVGSPLRVNPTAVPSNCRIAPLERRRLVDCGYAG